MATSQPAFASRAYGGGIGRTGGQSAFQSQQPYNTNTPFNGPTQNPGGFGTAVASGPATTQQAREATRFEDEKNRRAERERLQAAEQNALDNLSEEQREEVNEAVSTAGWVS